MKANCVIDFWCATEALDLDICIDGGWAVDAVLNRQTRPHADLDIALPASKVSALRQLLANRRYSEVLRSDSWEHNFVMQDPEGREIDVHSYIMNPDGSSAGGVDYCAAHLDGMGIILGTPVRCVPPDWQVRSRSGYELRRRDWHDVHALCAAFNIPIPADLRVKPSRP